MLLLSCATGTETVVEEEEQAVVVESPIGHYRQGAMELWVREDSTFVLREGGGATDVSQGRFGRWQMTGEELVLRPAPQQEVRYRFVQQGLQRVGGEGAAPQALENAEQQRQGEVPMMRITGEYRSVGESHSFTPCGSNRAFPLAVGNEVDQLAEVHAEAMRNQSLPVFLEVEVHLAPGPAMEGEGEEDYLYLQRVGDILQEQRCPSSW